MVVTEFTTGQCSMDDIFTNAEHLIFQNSIVIKYFFNVPSGLDEKSFVLKQRNKHCHSSTRQCKNILNQIYWQYLSDMFNNGVTLEGLLLFPQLRIRKLFAYDKIH